MTLPLPMREATVPGSHQMLIVSSGDGIADRKTIGSTPAVANAPAITGSTPPAGKTRHRNPEPRSAWAGCQCAWYRAASAAAIWAQSSALTGSRRPAASQRCTTWAATARSSGEPRWTSPSSRVGCAATAGFEGTSAPGSTPAGGTALRDRSWPSISATQSGTCGFDRRATLPGYFAVAGVGSDWLLVTLGP